MEPVNLLKEADYAAVVSHEWIDDDGLVAPPVNTTNTIWGYITNVKFEEKDLIKRVTADEVVVEYHCNFGTVTYESYVKPEKKKTSNRGRKPVPKVKKDRKRQGNGNDLNSQITMVILKPNALPNDTLLQPKVFRNGKVQIPGVHIHEVHFIREIIESRIRLHFPTAEFESMMLAMSNYRWTMRLPENVYVDMTTMSHVVRQIMSLGDATSSDFEYNGKKWTAYKCDGHPKMFDAELKRGAAKLSIKFLVPGPKFKTILLNIFRGGKTNVQGVYNPELTTKIWNYVRWLFDTYPLLCNENNIPAPVDNVDDDGSKPVFVY